MRRLCYAVTVLLCFSNFLFAQVNSASLTGLITDSSGATVAHVRVTAQSADTGYTRTVETDPSGYYFFQELPIGSYRVTVSSQGFATLGETVTLNTAEKVRRDFTLRVGTTEETVEVTATAPSLSPDDASIGTVMGADAIEKTPLFLRNWDDLVTAIEVVNGGVPEGPFAGFSFWEQQLRDGLRPTAIGGSDNHRPELAFEKAGSVGSPTTVVYASELSIRAILDAIRAGHVFVDLTGSRDRLLELSVSSEGNSAAAGDTLRAPSGADIRITSHVAGCQGSSVALLLDGHADAALPTIAVHQNDATFELSWKSDGKKHWLRAEVRTAEGKLQLLGNPVYINYPDAL
jgi:hypothetical protein